MQNFLQWCHTYAHPLHQEIRDRLNPADVTALMQVVDMYARDFADDRERSKTLKSDENASK